jgi:hypothetical protein
MTCLGEIVHSRLNSEKACYHSLSGTKKKTPKIKKIILTIVLFGGEACAITLKEVNRLKIFRELDV